MKWSEGLIQRYLFNWVTDRRHQLFAPNIYFYSYESDFLSVDSKNRTHDFEIKISRSDYKADFKKSRHSLFSKLLGKAIPVPKRRFKGYNAPNFFWYVCPALLIKKEEIPPYAGLIYVYTNGSCKVIKRPKQLHKKITDVCLISKKICVSLGYRWFKRKKR